LINSIIDLRFRPLDRETQDENQRQENQATGARAMR
jgi:hypothetical protein